MLVRSAHPTPLGLLPLVASEVGLRAILWPVERPGRVRLGEQVADLDRPADHPVLAAAAQAVDAYLADPHAPAADKGLGVALDVVGTPFQLAVWEALRAIGPGTTTSYLGLATAVGRPTAARAVGAAVGRNPVSILVPCHRVVGAAGGLTGFAGGLEAKRWLLAHEGPAEVRASGPRTGP